MKFLKSKNTLSELSDAELISKYKTQQDLEILAVLYGKYMHLVYGVCLKYLKSEEESQDAVMQIFEELTQKLLQYQVTNFRSWLYVVSKNLCLMWLRKQQKQVQVSLEDQVVEIGVDSHHSEWKIQESQFQQMEQCMEQLNELQRNCVRLFYLDQKCYKEIEQKTGLDAMKVKSHIQNGKRNLRICMERNKNHG